MGIFDSLFGNDKSSNSNQSQSSGIISSGGQKISGGHDHRTNKGDDRTPAQKAGDESKKNK